MGWARGMGRGMGWAGYGVGRVEERGGGKTWRQLALEAARPDFEAIRPDFLDLGSWILDFGS